MPNTGYTNKTDLEFDSKIERTISRLRREEEQREEERAMFQNPIEEKSKKGNIWLLNGL